MQLQSPSGAMIVGTSDLIPGTALASSWVRTSDGSFKVEQWDGWTKVWWDGQESIEKDGVLQVVDENGDEWDVTECTPIEEDE